jgi:DNA sulfur modification protein DndC
VTAIRARQLEILQENQTDQSATMLSAAERVRIAKADLRDEYLEPSHTFPWIVGYSGGKDSTLLLQLVMEMVMELAPSDRQRPLHVVCNDTRVESPLVAEYVDRMLTRLTRASESLRLPLTVAKTQPEAEQTFWVRLIGKGYPAPNRSFRWCTDRMKIQPTSNYIRKQVAANGEVILLLGVRRDESATRSGSIGRYENTIRDRLNPHSDLKGCLVYRPIVDFTIEEVWSLLMQRPPPWGGSHRDLITLYRNAQGGECPLVIDKSQAPSCGTSSSRFGCWTCTVVEKDRSMEGFIESGAEHLAPLLDFRDWLAETRNDPQRRTIERRDGSVKFMEKKDNEKEKAIFGPYTMDMRREMLERLLALQQEVNLPLITEEEVFLIKRIWAEDTITGVQRANSLPMVEAEL